MCSGQRLGLQHRKVKFKDSFALSYDLAGPFKEIGKTPEGTGFKYLLVAGFRVPTCLFKAANQKPKDASDPEAASSKEKDAEKEAAGIEEELDQLLLKEAAEARPPAPGPPAMVL